MAAIFQIRRGSGSVSLVDGELYVNKGIDSLQYAVNDREITLAKLDELNSGSLTLSGDLSASNAWISGNVRIEGNLFLGNQTTDTITATGEFTSDLVPNPTDTYNLGEDSKRWKRIYANSVSASAFTGSLYGMGDPTSFSTSVDSRLDILESSASLYDVAMSGSNRLYVSPSGSDDNDGLEPYRPFKTIKAAVESLGAAQYTNVNRTTIFVGSGNYTEQNPIIVPPGVSIVGDTLRNVRLTAANPQSDFFHVHDSNYFYGLRFLGLQSPSFAFSFPCSTAIANINGGEITDLTMVYTADGYTNGETVNVIIEGPDDLNGTTATATATVSGGTLSIHIDNNGSGYTSGEKPHVSIQAPTTKRPVITTSPYIQNCSSITGPFDTDGLGPLYRALPYDTSDIDEQGAGGGIRIDGNLVHPLSPLESFVADAFTQVNQGGPGHLVINKGYAQFVSCFTTFCTYGFKVANGGFANISNSVIDFGKYGLISKTYYPTTYNTAESLETKTSVVSGFVLDENGAGYTGSVAGVTIIGGGASVQATAQATVNQNGSIDEIVLLTPGSGYTYEPTVVIDTPTGPGAIQATTVGGKAKISGVTGILISVDDSVRGVDISSNMILNGVDYLVTNVTAGNSQWERIVTTYPAPPSIQTGDSLDFYSLSNISTGGLVMEYVGSGVTYNALPKYGGVPDRAKEINEILPGRVFYSTVDNIGNLKIGDFFAVNQLTGEVTIDANSFNLSGLNAIGPFKRNGVGVGVVLQEVSNNTTLLNAEGNYGEDTTPTQYAVKGYIDIRDARLDKLEQTSGSLNTWTASAKIELNNLEITSQSNNSRLDNLESKSASVDISVSNLNSYTASLNNAIELTGSTVSFLGDIVVYGTQSVLNSINLEIADNMIYLNATSSTTNVDLGVVGNYNDGTYAHTGIYRDSADGVWRVFKGYTQEPSGNIDLSHPSYQYADFYANALSASTLSGIGNVTSYSTSVNSRLVSLETTTTTGNVRLDNLESFSSSILSQNVTLAAYTASINSKINSIQSFTHSANIRLGKLEESTASLNSFTSSTGVKFDYVANTTQSLNNFTASANGRLNNLETFSSSILTQNVTLAQITSSLQSYTASANNWSGGIDGKFTTLSTYTSSVDNSLSLLNLFSASVTSSLVNIYQTTSSLNSFSASATESIVELYWTASNHESRIDYIEGVAFGGIDLNAQFAALQIVTSSLQSFTSSASGRLNNIETFSSSTNTRLDNIELTTSSLNSFSSSINTTIKDKLNAEHVFSGSAQLATTYEPIASGTHTLVSGSSQIISILNELNNHSASLNTFTSSFDTAIGLSGTNVTVKGNLTIQGTTTQIDSTTVNIADNIIQLNAAGTSDGGIIVRDASGATTNSGSLIYDVTNDYWKAGASGAESKILLANGMNVVSSSSQLSTIYEPIASATHTLVSSSAQIDGAQLGSNKTITIAGTSVTLGGVISAGTIGNAIGAFSGSSQVTLSSTTGGGTSANVQFGSLGIGTAASGVTGEIRATGDITAYYSSDIRLKENIQPITNALSKVEAISGKTYDWKEGFETIHSHTGNDLGVIAQEVQSILPQIVTERETGYLAVDYIKLVPVLIEAIKELSAKVKELENK